MPQLNPSPWFLILAFSWLVFLTIVPSKVMAHEFPNEPASHTKQGLPTGAWAWPWH
uniref:ATP synthase complex subunit 8 n=1 Tax=Poropanchax normani TaxID=691897 RepID=A0A8F8XCK6_9TELE|nr:ATP synthase F0 subunit 8 [Poropanchax normani]